MKTAILFAAVAVTVSSLPALAQQTGTAADQNTSAATPQAQAREAAGANAQATPSSASANGAVAHSPMRPVNCELVGKLDSKSAKVGDTVVAKAMDNVRLADGTPLPKGARLIGHVTSVQAHSSSQPDAHLALAFDRAEWSGGNSIQIHAMIAALTQPVNSFANESAGAGDSMAGPIGPGGRGLGGGRSGGGGLAGTADASVSGLGQTAGSVGSNPASAANGTLRNTAQIPGDASAATSTVGYGAYAATGLAASMSAHATGVPGVILAGDASGASSGTLSSSKRNVHLDSGTQMVLAVSPAGDSR